MHISNRQKIGLFSIAGLVIVDILFDILRGVYTVSSYATSFPDANTVWGLCEPTIAVMICALPVYRSLLSPKLVSTTSYPEYHGTSRSFRRNNTAEALTTSIPAEMDELASYSLNSNPSAVESNLKGKYPDMNTNLSQFTVGFPDLAWESAQPAANISPKAWQVNRPDGTVAFQTQVITVGHIQVDGIYQWRIMSVGVGSLSEEPVSKSRSSVI
ncbi:pyridine nucleotide-disulfide oxidoreductase like protein [Rutstroemia sp. NJR-2017a BBW]|nr:pyridine nucleotide-disulfide oxidoreductase like protein [Rutstroemia sp. NJR-2017a BBW]